MLFAKESLLTPENSNVYLLRATCTPAKAFESIGVLVGHGSALYTDCEIIKMSAPHGIPGYYPTVIASIITN